MSSFPFAPQYILCYCLSLLCSLGLAQNSGNKLVAPGATLVKIDSSFKFTEGPAVDTKGNVYFTDQPNNQIMVWSIEGGVKKFMDKAGRSNGLYFDQQGYLVACADENNELWRINSKGEHEVLLGDIDGKRMNGPNDLWVDAKGGIYFTDPFYQRPWWDHEKKPIDSENVYYLSPGAKQPKVVAEDLVKPNGIVGSRNGKFIYIADIGDKKTYRYKIAPDGSLTDKKLFTNLGSDGMTIDHRGNVYLTGNGVSVFNKRGEKIHQIMVPEKWTANVVFGGPNQKALIITAMGSIYSLKMQVHGIR